MNVIERAKAILLKPAETWPVIDGEPATVASIYKDWLVVMCAIPVVCAFIGFSLIGFSMFGYGGRIPVLWGLERMVTHYLVSLVGAFVLALLVDALAPTFGGTKNQLSALKVVAYGSTAAFLGGLFSLLPSLSFLGLIAACYSIYLVYLGLPVLMKCPQDKAAAYTAVVIVIGFVAAIVLGALSALVMPGRGSMFYGGGHSGGAITITTPSGETVDTDALAKRMDAARARMEAAQKSGDPASATAVLGDVLGALTGAGGTPIPAADLKAQLPETLGALKRESFETSGGSAMGISSSMAKAGYVAGDQRAQLTITDAGGLGGLASVATWANVTVDKETPDAIEKTYKDGGRTVHEAYRKDGSHADYTVILKNGVIVETSGDKIDGATLKSMASGVNLDAIEAMKRPAKS